MQIDWGVALTQAIGNIPSAIVTATVLYWITHANRKISEGFEKNGDRVVFGKKERDEQRN